MIKLPKLSPILRISLGLTALTTTIIFVASFLGIFPDVHSEKLEARRQFTEAVAETFTSKSKTVGIQIMNELLQSSADQHPDLLSIGVRRKDGTEVMEIEDHFANWKLSPESASTDSEIYVPVHNGEELWGTVETRYQPLIAPGIMGTIRSYPEVSMAAFVGLITLLSFYIYLRSVLQQLNPRKVIPPRVRNAFNSLAEGVLVLDGNERIVLANRAFEEAVSLPIDDLMGKLASQLPFLITESGAAPPWKSTLAGTSVIQRQVMKFDSGDQKAIFSVSSAPILDEKGRNHGAMVSFENVTNLESQRAELELMVGKLTESTEQITIQNQKLERLATIDPLTNCLNRRSFLTKFETLWEGSDPLSKPLTALMVDIDHFKAVNDNHGHAVGDDVLRAVAKILQTTSQESDVVCRFGGEEFAILMPNTEIEHAKHVADRMRIAIAALQFNEVSVTVSIGASSRCYRAASEKELLEQADKSLYFAKRNGRNRIVDWADVPADVEIDESKLSREPADPVGDISFHAVTALISSLAFRDQATANHCRRVADLCVAIGEDMLGLSACFTLEVAGLLHDIGKLSLPDSILLKQGKLTDDEWKVMRRHESMGVELVRTSFANPDLTEIIQHFRIPYDQIIAENLEVSQGARILAIMDAYASMTSDHAFRNSMTPEEASGELLKCAGHQFDPDLVERVIKKLESKSLEMETHRDEVSRSAALSIGLQIERLSKALEKLDSDEIETIALRLAVTAENDGATQIAEKAQLICKLNEELVEDGENYDLVMSTIELLDMCRASQKALIETISVD